MGIKYVLNPFTGVPEPQEIGTGGPPSGPAGGDLAGSYPNPTVVAFEETSTPARLAIAGIPNGTILKRVGATIVGVAAAFPPSGAAGGDLASTYPNPTVIACEETGGPTRLPFAKIPARSFLTRGISSTVEGAETGVFPVSWYGAKGDGVTDDTAAIQAAIDAVGPMGGEIRFAAGRSYKITAQLDADDYQGLVFGARSGVAYLNATTLLFTGNRNSTLISARSTFGFQMRGLTVNANAVVKTGGLVMIVDTSHSAAAADSGYCVFEDCSFTGTTGNIDHGIYVGGNTIGPIFFNCAFTNITNGISGGVFAADGSSAGYVQNCSFIQCDHAGILNPTYGWTIQSCVFENKSSGANGLILKEQGVVTGFNLSILGCSWADGSTGPCISLTDTYGTTIQSNAPTGGIGSSFCFFSGCGQIVASGNVITTEKAYTFDGVFTSFTGEFGPDYFPGTYANYIGSPNLSGITTKGFGFSGGANLSLGFGNATPVDRSITVGNFNTPSAFSIALGFFCNPYVLGISTGAGAVGRQLGGVVQGAGTALGVGANQIDRYPIEGSIAGGTTANMVQCTGSGPGFLGGSGTRSYTLTVKGTILPIGVPASSLRVTLEVLATTVAGVMAILNQASTIVDPGGTGITVAAVAAGNTLEFAVTNPTGGTVDATFSVSTEEATY